MLPFSENTDLGSSARGSLSRGKVMLDKCQRVSRHTAQALQAEADFQTHMCSFTTQKVKGSDSIQLTAVARAYDERIRANSSSTGFSHPNSCLSLLGPLLSPGFLIKLFEIEDKLKIPPTLKKPTDFPAEQQSNLEQKCL